MCVDSVDSRWCLITLSFSRMRSFDQMDLDCSGYLLIYSKQGVGEADLFCESFRVEFANLSGNIVLAWRFVNLSSLLCLISAFRFLSFRLSVRYSQISFQPKSLHCFYFLFY